MTPSREPLSARFPGLGRMAARFAGLGQRERAWVFLAVLFLFGFLIADRLHQVTQQRWQQQKQITRLKTETRNLETALTRLRAERLALAPEQARQRLQEDITRETAGFISPGQMHEVLRTILASTFNVKVLALNSPPATLISDPKDRQKLYRHSLELTLSGNYFDIIRYLRAIEQARGIHWQALDYQVTQWPNNTVQVELFSLSLEEALVRARERGDV